MNYKQKYAVAMNIASILTKNEATVNDMNAIFDIVQNCMLVRIKSPFESFGKIIVPDSTHDGDGIRDE